MEMEEPLTSTVRPSSMAIITVRVIKSFPYRTIKNHVFKNVDLHKVTAGELRDMIKEVIKTQGAFRAFRNNIADLDTIKIYTKAHGSKTMSLVVNMENDDEWILADDSKTLAEYGVENETELSIFNRAAYEEFKKNPEEKW
ncbi:altered inheritance rate of mitochondria protein 29 [Trichomonascus vanleenenianus]|uniref:Aim29p n=1 Tax=Trichomonascus vanleenenianus TaxID=2268995 RepID=UPI003ECB233A